MPPVRRMLPIAAMTLLLAVAACASPPSPTPAARLAAAEALIPPWQHGANNGATERGLEFTVPPVDDLADFHGSPDDALLVLFVGGNYFFAMAPLVEAFGRAHPDYAGRIYYETLPPGLLERQMEAGGVVKDAPHPQAAREWLEFIHSDEAIGIFGKYGFKRYAAGGGKWMAGGDRAPTESFRVWPAG